MTVRYDHQVDIPGRDALALHRIPLAGRLVRTRLKQGTHVRDEQHQARELTKTLSILETERVDGAFVWTFADPWLTYDTDPRYDLDMTSTALVKTCAQRNGSTLVPEQRHPAALTYRRIVGKPPT